MSLQGAPADGGGSLGSTCRPLAARQLLASSDGRAPTFHRLAGLLLPTLSQLPIACPGDTGQDFLADIPG